MSTVTLGKRPSTFKPFTVKFQMPDGSEGSILVTYKYRTRTEFGDLIDGIFKDAGRQRPDGEPFSMRELMEGTRNKNGDYLAAVIEAWNLDEPLTVESLRQLCDELPAAAAVIMEAYRTAALEGRLGN
ncbi:MAG: phage tail assembly chaperone [Alphaproteobacteria bacterium]|nr:phage tail assembly chaperone [Alphaproteobacteria bacterium]